MNCQLCQKELDAYREGLLPDGIKVPVEEHLKSCKICAESYQLMILANTVMDKEKTIQSNPFLATRIMAEIEELELQREQYQRIPVYQKVLKPALISISLAAAMFIGIIAGNIHKPAQHVNNKPVEMMYMNDAALESVAMFSNL